MFIVLVLSFFLALSMVVVSSFESTSSTGLYARKIYIKQQAYHALVSVLPYILEGLRREDQSFDSLLDPWTLPFEIETEKGKLSVVIYDEDRFLNLNFIHKDKVYREIFERLLTLLEISPGYSERVLAWIGKGGSFYGGEYPVKGSLMDSPEELRYIGMSDAELYGKTVGDVTFPGILSLVTTYSSGKININTAPKYILMALDPKIDDALAERIIEYRSAKPFRKPQDIVLVEGVSFDILYRIEKVIDIRSTHFRIIANLKTGDVETTLEVIYDRFGGRVVYKRIY